VDTSTGAVADGLTLSAPTTSSMITPVTTLLEEGSLTQAEVVAALGLPATFDPLTFDAFSTTLSAADKTTALAAEKVSQKVMAAVTTFAAVAEGSGASEALAFEAAMSSVVSVLATASAASTTMTVSNADVTAISTAMAAQYDAGGKLKALVDAGTADKGTFTAQSATTVAAVQNVATAITAITSEDLSASKDLFSVVQVMTAQAKTAATTAKSNGNVAEAVAMAAVTDADGDGVADVVATAAANAAPSAITLSASAISEDASSLVVGTVTTTDADNSSGHTYAIVESVGTDYASFTIDASTGVLSLKAQPDYETKTSYTVNVSTTDSGGKAFADTLTISVTDVNESGAFGISSDVVTWTDYDPSTSATITNQIHTSTSSGNVTIGASNLSAYLNRTNLLNFTDDDAATTGTSPDLKFTLDSVPTGSGTATIKATITDGTDGTRTGTEDQISLTVNVAYIGDGTSATLTVPAGTATGSYNKGDGTDVTFNLSNGDYDAFSITADESVTGVNQWSLNVKVGKLYDAFIAGGGAGPGGSIEMIQLGDYHLALETTLPLQNYANETVTKFDANVELVASTKASIIGTAGADAITGTSAAEIIVAGGGADTIATGGGADFIVLAAGFGSTTLASSNTVSDFTNGTTKFALDGLTFSDLTVAADATTSADTVVSVTSTSEYLMTITGVAYGYIDTNDFVLTTDIA
jgi:hypothetical protein